MILQLNSVKDIFRVLQYFVNQKQKPMPTHQVRHSLKLLWDGFTMMSAWRRKPSIICHTSYLKWRSVSSKCLLSLARPACFCNNSKRAKTCQNNSSSFEHAAALVGTTSELTLWNVTSSVYLTMILFTWNDRNYLFYSHLPSWINLTLFPHK